VDLLFALVMFVVGLIWGFVIRNKGLLLLLLFLFTLPFLNLYLDMNWTGPIDGMAAPTFFVINALIPFHP